MFYDVSTLFGSYNAEIRHFDESFKQLSRAVGLISRVLANSPGSLDSVPRQVIPKAQKMVHDAAFFNTQHYKVRIKANWNNPGNGVAPSRSPRVIEKRTFGSPSTKVANFTYKDSCFFIHSIWPIDRTLLGVTTLGQNESGSDGCKGVLRIPQIFSITEASPSDCLVSYAGHSLKDSYFPARVQSVYYATPVAWATLFCVETLKIFVHPNLLINIFHDALMAVSQDYSFVSILTTLSLSLTIYIYIYIYTRFVWNVIG